MSSAYQKAASQAGIHYYRTPKVRLRRFYRQFVRVSNGAVEFKSQLSSDGQITASKRGVIVDFSRKSAKRLMITALNFEHPIEWWQTFTFADDVMVSKSVQDRAVFSSKVLKTFKEWLGSYYPGMSGLWRREWETRKSGALKGQICPHFHMVLRNGHNEYDYLQTAMALGRLWVRCTGSSDPAAFEVATKAPIMQGQDVRKKGSFQYLYNPDMAICYLAKYMSKKQDATIPGDEVEEFGKSVDGDPENRPSALTTVYPSLGRMWGKIGSPKLSPYAEIPFGGLQGYMIKRLFKGIMRSKYRRWGEIKNCPHLWKAKARLMAGRIDEGDTWLLVRRETTIKLFDFVQNVLSVPPF